RGCWKGFRGVPAGGCGEKFAAQHQNTQCLICLRALCVLKTGEVGRCHRLVRKHLRRSRTRGVSQQSSVTIFSNNRRPNLEGNRRARGQSGKLRLRGLTGFRENPFESAFHVFLFLPGPNPHLAHSPCSVDPHSMCRLLRGICGKVRCQHTSLVESTRRI
ncbi:unnamed protein product, partial [Hapterophycus canaliculatus]